MKKVAVFLAFLCVFAAVLLAAEFTTMAFSGVGPLALTNTQENTSWSLEGVVFNFGVLPTDTSTVTVSRVSGGVRYVLSSVTNATENMWWAADGVVPVKYGDAVRFDFGAGSPTGMLQIIQGTR